MKILQWIKEIFCIHHVPNTFLAFNGPRPSDAYPARNATCIKCGKYISGRWEHKREIDNEI